MVKLVDTPASGAGDLTVVEVRVFSWAPISSLRLDQFQDSHKTRESGFFAFCARDFSENDLLKSNQGFTDQKALRIVRHINGGNAEDEAQMVKLVDTPASGAGDLTVVEVRVFFWAPIQIQGHDLEFHKNPRKRVFAFPGSGKDESKRLPDLPFAHKAHLRNNIVYHCCKFLQCDSEEPCE